MKSGTGIIFCILVILSFVSSAEEVKPPVENYETTGHKWNTFPVIYVEPFDPNDQIKSNLYKGAIQWALDRWIENCAVAWMLDKIDEDNKPNVVVHWVDNYTQLPPPFNIPGYVGMADHNNVWIVKKDKENNDIPWEVAQDIALHEFGHVWGLGHSKDEKDVMHELVNEYREDCKCYAPNKKKLTARDADMLNFVFKGFEMDIDYSHNKQNKLIMKYSITSKLGDLLDVRGERVYILNSETSGNIILYDISLKKDDTRHLDYLTETDISIVKTLTAKIWIKDATLQNVKKAKFINQKFYQEDIILTEKQGRLLTGPSIPLCSGEYCHSFTNTSIVRGYSFNLSGLTMLGISLLIIGILAIRKIKK